jgi:hypothetical protein
MSRDAAGELKCMVVSGETFLAKAGGADALCGAIRQSLGKSGAREAKVQVRKFSQFKVTVTMRDGRDLPSLDFMEADRPMSAKTFARLAAAVAVHVQTTDQQTR